MGCRGGVYVVGCKGGVSVVGVESMLWFVRGRAYEVSCRGWSLVVGCREVGSMLWGEGGGLVSMLWVVGGGVGTRGVYAVGYGWVGSRM